MLLDPLILSMYTRPSNFESSWQVTVPAPSYGFCVQVVTRTWQTADKMKIQRGVLSEDKDGGNDNYRIKRYVSKYTINPALMHGVAHVIGSIEVSKPKKVWVCILSILMQPVVGIRQEYQQPSAHAWSCPRDRFGRGKRTRKSLNFLCLVS
jgi:hypothetical protein